MDLLDSDLFVLDLRFRDDQRYLANKAFLETRGAPRATTIYNLLEVCGILSFNLTHAALLALYAEFSRRYALSVLFPAVADHQSLSTIGAAGKGEWRGRRGCAQSRSMRQLT